MRPLLVTCTLALLPAAAGAAEAVDFVRDVKPILAKRCVRCHGPEKQRASLRLDSATAIRKGGNSGPSVVPGKPADSPLVQAVLHAEGVKPMPPTGARLAAKDVAALRAWVAAGAPVPPGEVVTATTVRSDHWAFQPVRRPAHPAVKQVSWVRNPVDAFVLARLEEDGVKPSPEADPVTLLRRVSLDLTGLPPAPAEVDAFLADKRPGAYERAVDRLLASPHYGERWGRHWLDLARYADSNGYSIDAPRSIWMYRDWVIAALNADKPFDVFTTEQLAGDLLPGATREQRIATGFHRNTQINEEGGIDKEQFRVEAVVDRTNTTGAVFLGLTVGCAQCHDHKYDPLTQKEYYKLYAFFNHSDDPKLDVGTSADLRRRREADGRVGRLQKQLQELDGSTPERVAMWEGSLNREARKTLPARVQSILAIAPNGRSASQEQAVLTAYRRADGVRHVAGAFAGPWSAAAHAHLLTTRTKLERQLATGRKRVPSVDSTLVLSERKVPRMTTVQLGGDFLRKGAVVEPGVPAVLPPLKGDGRQTRLDLARWLTSRDNPLTPRVTVNRVWQQFFGLGLVETENDFGTQGLPPSHPELLDWLAAELMDRQWSMKAFHRLLVTSATYRQSSHARADLAILDPRNRLLARQSRLRLEAEGVRDVALASSGLLAATVGGPGVRPPQPQGVYSFTQVPRVWTPDTGPDRYRRGMYTFFWRSAPHPGLTVFDAPDATATCTRRNRSNTPLQALTLLNDQAFFECAQALAARVLGAAAGDEDRVTYAVRVTLGRQPEAREREVLLRLLKRQRDSLAKDPAEARALVPADLAKASDLTERAAWTLLARVLLNLDEFITRE